MKFYVFKLFKSGDIQVTQENLKEFPVSSNHYIVKIKYSGKEYKVDAVPETFRFMYSIPEDSSRNSEVGVMITQDYFRGIKALDDEIQNNFKKFNITDEFYVLIKWLSCPLNLLKSSFVGIYKFKVQSGELKCDDVIVGSLNFKRFSLNFILEELEKIYRLNGVQEPYSIQKFATKGETFEVMFSKNLNYLTLTKKASYRLLAQEVMKEYRAIDERK